MPQRTVLRLAALLILSTAAAATAADWWNPSWTIRQRITINTAAGGGKFDGVSGAVPVLLRLVQGNFNFDAARDDGSDIRFTTADGKTALPFHIERYDRALNEALVWVQVPNPAAASATEFHLYSGNPAEGGALPASRDTYDADTSLVYHFSDAAGPPTDASAGGNNATATSLAAAGSLIAGGVRLTGQSPVIIPASGSLNWPAGGTVTWSAWVKADGFRAGSIIFGRRDNGSALLIGEDNGVPFVEVTANGTTTKTAPGTPLTLNQWTHLAVTASAGVITLWCDGESYSSINAVLPAFTGGASLGRDQGPGAANAPGFNGEVDELQISRVARSPGWLRFAAVSQSGSPAASELVLIGEPQAGAASAPKANFFKEHFGIFGDISKSLTVDGWAVIILCSILALVGGSVAVAKLRYLNRIQRASAGFTSRWEALSNDITALDQASEDELKSLGGKVSGSELDLVRQSPLFHIYHLGAQEIRKRIQADGAAFAGLSGRSIEAIKARLDGGLVDEEEKLNSKLVFLTLGIAGGPYLGLLGTVIGVMITFAVIAKSGEVEVNSIAPGIAGALLATVAGLAVAIPALFSYSYLNSRTTSAVNGIRKFIDEFITRIAEAYPERKQS